MGFLEFFKKDKLRGNYLVALDIGSEFVKAIVFEISKKDNTAVIVGYSVVAQELSNMDNGAVADIKGVVSTARRAVDEAVRNARKKLKTKINPKQVVLGIAGEFVKGITTTVKYERSNSENKIDVSEFKNIIQKVQWKAFDKVRSQFAWETGLSDIDVRLINASITEIQIDGYKVTNPLGFQGKDITISIFNGYAPLVHLGSLQTIVDDLGLNLLNIAVEPFAIAKSVNFKKGEDLNAIFIDVGSTTTDIAVVRNGGIEGTKSFALGGRMFSKRLAQELGIGLDEAERLKVKYSQGDLSSPVVRKIKTIIKNDCRVWISGIELCLSEFTHINLLPAQIYLCGGASSLPDLDKCLIGKEWIKSLPFSRRPVVEYIKKENIENVIDKTNKLDDSQSITVMSLANLSLDLVEKDIISDILQKTIRIMQN